MREFKKSDPCVSDFVQKCYPSYKGRRKVKVESREQYTVRDYWDGGSRDYSEFYHIPTRRVVGLDSVPYEKQERGNAFGLSIGKVTMTPGVAVVENVVFQGKDLGIRIYVHPDDLNKFGG